MDPLPAAFVAFTLTLCLGLWVALTMERREHARRTLLVYPDLAEVELAYEPFVYSLVRVARLVGRTRTAFFWLAVIALVLVLSGRAPTSYASDEQLAEWLREAWENPARDDHRE